MSLERLDSRLGITTPAPREMESPRGRISLLIFHGEQARIETLAEGQRLVVGRDPTAEVAVDDKKLSRRHAFFEVRNGEVWIEDLGSTNGTKLDGHAVSRGRLAPGSEVAMGSLTASIHMLASSPPSGLESHEAFLAAICHEALRARTFNRGFAVLAVKLTANGSCTALRELLRPVDRIASYSPAVCEILLAESTPQDARTRAQRLIESGAVTGCGVSLYPQSGNTEDLLHSALRALRHTSTEQPLVVTEGTQQQRGPILQTETGSELGFIVRSPAMVELYSTVDRLANSVIPVLLEGETGCGKEVIAQALHERSARGGKIASINCGAIPESLDRERALRSHEKGAFTGAATDSPGRPLRRGPRRHALSRRGRRAVGLRASAALLRVLETRTITRDESARDERNQRRRSRGRGDIARPRAAMSRRSAQFRQDLLLPGQHDGPSRCRPSANAPKRSRRLAQLLRRTTPPQANGCSGRGNRAPDALRATAPLRLARQRARATQRDRARRGHRSAAIGSQTKTCPLRCSPPLSQRRPPRRRLAKPSFPSQRQPPHPRLPSLNPECLSKRPKASCGLPARRRRRFQR
jgi:hypothetical protein